MWLWAFVLSLALKTEGGGGGNRENGHTRNNTTAEMPGRQVLTWLPGSLVCLGIRRI